ncbi:RagB/SusD family nutrient uptake outer membrane protein [Bacteroides heparinolyticus]|uniref:RagB/SusD family nutrient uptake outer membrane protein n=1 Tax=Prevotella heparinolytica TaxID=28113 RepID=UPI003AF18BBD
MKRFIYIVLTVFSASFSFQACDLERYPLTDLSEDKFWNDDKNAELALTSLYRGSITNGVEFNVSDFWSYHGLLFMEHLTDNAYDRRGENNPFFSISSGKLLNNNAFIKNYWSSAYKRIGLCNRFLEGIATAPDSERKTRMIAEARFLRATQYHYLASYFKDVPLVTKTLSGEEANTVTKETQANILSWCITEFKEAAANLPRFKDIPNSQTGRACKQAALAFLGRTCMLKQNWAEGTAAYKEIISYGDNSIHPTYKELFMPETGVGNQENIFYISYLENYFGCGVPQHILPAKDGGWSLSNPSAGLFESYEFKDGTPFSYDDPRYDPQSLGKDRDPRLDYTIYYNGATFMGTEYRMHPDYEASKKERLDYSSEASRTGFMWRKYFDGNPINDLKSYSAVTPVIRYAEVLLSYLECMIESGQTIEQSLLDTTVNLVRGRADVKMPPITETNPDKLRELVRRERRIELAYEGIRYWDLLRWNIAHEVLVGEVWGAPYPNSKTYASSSKFIDPSGHFRWYVGRRDFRNPQDYKWPVPLSEQNINPNLRE